MNRKYVVCFPITGIDYHSLDAILTKRNIHTYIYIMWGANGIQIRFAESMLLHFILNYTAHLWSISTCALGSPSRILGLKAEEEREDNWTSFNKHRNVAHMHVHVLDVDTCSLLYIGRGLCNIIIAVKSMLWEAPGRLSENLDDLMLSFHVTDSPSSSFMFSWHCSITPVSFKQSNVKIGFPKNAPQAIQLTTFGMESIWQVLNACKNDFFWLSSLMIHNRHNRMVPS